jgi:predicted DNA-binding protein (MmcQ/YjbR family)
MIGLPSFPIFLSSYHPCFMPPRPLTKLRKLCLALPEAHEVEAWGAPTFRVKNKLFAMFAAASDHHGAGRNGVWLKAAPGNQQLMVRDAPDKFFVPPYVGPSGWVGVYLDGDTDWDEARELISDSYQLVAPKKLVKLLLEES